ncbi:MAG: IS66 family transposase [Simkania sp.]|nr:IS66 family transposase [Simkania sp.]
MPHSQEYVQLLLEIMELRQIIAEQKEQIAVLLKENQELKEKLGTNSSNGSKAPSQDPNRKSRRSESTGRKPGGQPGHTGHKRTLYPPEKVSKIIEVRPEICPGCTSLAFERTPVAVEVRQVIDLPEISPEITQYNIYTCKCLGCLKHVRGDVPKEAERGFGPRLMGFMTMLTGEGHLTKRKICSIAAHLELKISLGALCNIHRLAGDLLQAPAGAIQQFVLKQEQLNADESSWRVLKKRCWIWVGATSKATFFKIDPSRSSQAYRRIFGVYCGTLTTDRHGAYNEHEGPKQSCLAHIDRHFEKMSERPGVDGSFGRVLEGQLDLIFGLWGEFKQGAFSRSILQEKANEHIENIRAALIFTAREAKNSKSAALAHDLLGRFSTLWTFLFVEGVEPTNNLAERCLRPAVIFRKLSGGNQSDWGAQFTERLMTVVCTLKQNAMNTFTFLTEVFTAHQAARPPPTLVF